MPWFCMFVHLSSMRLHAQPSPKPNSLEEVHTRSQIQLIRSKSWQITSIRSTSLFLGAFYYSNLLNSWPVHGIHQPMQQLDRRQPRRDDRQRAQLQHRRSPTSTTTTSTRSAGTHATPISISSASTCTKRS